MTTTQNNNASAATSAPEQVGRTYERIRFGVHSRRIGTQDFYGTSNYRTLEEAMKALRALGQPILGGMVFECGKEPFEYRIVKMVSQCEVLHVENKLV